MVKYRQQLQPMLMTLLLAGVFEVLPSIKSGVERHLEVEDLGDFKLKMGCEVKRDRKAKSLTISQKGYTIVVCKRLGVNGALERTPYPPSRRLDGHEEDKACTGSVPYREAVGSLMWTALMTRINIASPVREVAKYCEEPKPVHWHAVLSILRYLYSLHRERHLFWRS
ncbi:unnamed protein product [Discosporangium mesarthrocarpum]